MIPLCTCFSENPDRDNRDQYWISSWDNFV